MFRTFLICAVMLCCALPALAQTNTLEADNPREEAALRLGPVYMTPRIELSEFGIDTNVFNRAGEKQKDFTFTLTPGVDLWLPIARRGLVKASADTGLVWYRELESERSVDPDFTLRGEAYLRRITLFGEFGYLRSRQRPSFEIDVRSRRVEDRFTGGFDFRVTPKFSIEFNGEKSSREFDADEFFLGSRLAERLNRDQTRFGTVLRFNPTVLTTIAVKADRFQDRFPLSPERDTDNVRVMPGVEFGRRALITGRAYVGVRQLTPVDETVLPDFTGLVSDLGLTYNVLGGTTIGITHTRDIRYSFEFTQPYYVDTGVGASVRRALGPRFDVLASVNRHTLAYRNLMLETVTAAPGRVDTVWNYGGSLGYRVGRDGRIGLGATYWKRDSTTRPGREYDGLRIGSTVSYGF